MQKEGLNNNLCVVLKDFIPSKVLTSRNRKKSFKYGYDADLDMIVTSKDGMVGDVVRITSLNIALPKKTKEVHRR